MTNGAFEMNLNQVTLPALDLPASIAFYREMGFRLIIDSPDYARFECPDGDATFSLHLVDGVADETHVTIYFEHDALDELCRRLQRAGFEFDALPTDQPWLWREAYLADPAGNTVCLYRAGENRRNPPWRVN